MNLFLMYGFQDNWKEDMLITGKEDMWMAMFLDGIMQNTTFGKVSRHFLTISMTV